MSSEAHAGFAGIEIQSSLADGITTRRTVPHFAHLDSIRGLMAFYVVLVHCHGIATNWIRVVDSRGVPGALRFVDFVFFGYGHYAVDVFIVLSGYCLMLPLAARHQRGMEFNRYARRRALRILPPYYAAVLLGMIMVACIPAMRTAANGDVGDASATFKLGAMLSHFALVQDFRLPWAYAGNQALWSVAVEWQIYFLFPLILLPAWRLGGKITCFAAAMVIGLAPHYLLPASNNLDWACPWYLALFALGMLGAVATFEDGSDNKAAITRRRYRFAAILSCVICVAVIYAQRKSWDNVRFLWPFRIDTWGSVWPLDCLIGLVSTIVLIHLANCARASNGSRSIKLLGHHWMVALGTISYSLYLVHEPIKQVTALAVHHFTRTLYGSYFATMIVCSVASVLFAWLFYMTVERPALRLRSRAIGSRGDLNSSPSTSRPSDGEPGNNDQVQGQPCLS